MLYQKIRFLMDTHGNRDVEVLYYKSHFVSIKKEESEYPEDFLKCNPQYEGKKCQTLVFQFKRMSSEKFSEIVNEWAYYLAKKGFVNPLNVDEHLKEVNLYYHYNSYHMALNFLEQKSILRYFYKTFSETPKIPNDGVSYYINAPLRYIPYNLFQLGKLYLKKWFFANILNLDKIIVNTV